MKSTFRLLLALILLFCTYALSEDTPETFTDGDYEWCLADGTAEITRYRGSNASLVIPNMLNGKRASSIGAEAFYGRSSLVSVSIPDTVTSIGNFAFSYCEALASVTIPYSVTSIGEGAFADCLSLESVRDPGKRRDNRRIPVC